MIGTVKTNDELSIITLYSKVLTIIKPILFLCFTLPFGITTALELVFNFRISSLLCWTKFSDEWFARLWIYYGPFSLRKDQPNIGNIIKESRGKVLDIGPGTGSTVHLLPKSRITKVYGIEPNLKLHAELRENIRRAGLESIYEIIGSAAESLDDHVFKHGSFDTVLSIKVICSVAEPEKVLNAIYPYLASGGQWLAFEHIKNTRSPFVGRYQGFIQLFWPYCFGGCNINRRTDELLEGTGEWKEVERFALNEERWEIMPHISWKLIKA